MKSQEAVRVPRDADPDAPSDFSDFMVIACQPKRTFSAKIESIASTIDPQCRGEPSWSSCQIAHAVDAAI